MTRTVIPVLVDRGGAVAALYEPDFLEPSVADQMLASVLACRKAFKSSFMLVGERWVKMPRLAAEFGDGRHLFPDTGPSRPWTAELRALRDHCERATDRCFNYAIVNWYRTGQDFTGWHTDKMDLHAPQSEIAMVSLGAGRRFEFRDPATQEIVSSTVVSHGSMLRMFGGSQVGYEHSLRPDDSVQTCRVSVTFRSLLPTPSRVCPTCGGCMAGQRSACDTLPQRDG